MYYSTISDVIKGISPLMVTFCFMLFGTIEGKSCEDKSYMDLATNICTPCNHCCPPRPKNRFCEKDCDLNKICPAYPTTSPTTSATPQNHWITGIVCSIILVIVVITFPTVYFIHRRKRKTLTRTLNHIELQKPTQESAGNPNGENQDHPLIPSCHVTNSGDHHDNTDYKSFPLFSTPHQDVPYIKVPYRSMPLQNRNPYMDPHYNTARGSDVRIASSFKDPSHHHHHHHHLTSNQSFKSSNLRGLAAASSDTNNSQNQFSIQCEEDVEKEKEFTHLTETNVKMVA